MQPNTVHNVDTLRALLARAARWDIEIHDARKDTVEELAFQFRDCRLELIRRGEITLSKEQLERLAQMDNRLDMVVTSHAVPDSIAVEAKRALAAFGWTTNI
jgi:hypothetical protein